MKISRRLIAKVHQELFRDALHVAIVFEELLHGLGGPQELRPLLRVQRLEAAAHEERLREEVGEALHISHYTQPLMTYYDIYIMTL